MIGLTTKNGILVVEFVDQLIDQGTDCLSAIKEASLTRLRPVVMTMLSIVLGGLPALFTLFLTPVVFLGLSRFQSSRADESSSLHAEMEQASEQSRSDSYGPNKHGPNKPMAIADE